MKKNSCRGAHLKKNSCTSNKRKKKIRASSFFVPTAGHLVAQVSHPRRSPGICQSPSQPFLGCHATQKNGCDGDYTRNLPSKAKKIIMPEVLIGNLNGYHACFKILRFLGSVPVILRAFRRLWKSKYKHWKAEPCPQGLVFVLWERLRTSDNNMAAFVHWTLFLFVLALRTTHQSFWFSLLVIISPAGNISILS